MHYIPFFRKIRQCSSEPLFSLGRFKFCSQRKLSTKWSVRRWMSCTEPWQLQSRRPTWRWLQSGSGSRRWSVTSNCRHGRKPSPYSTVKKNPTRSVTSLNWFGRYSWHQRFPSCCRGCTKFFNNTHLWIRIQVLEGSLLLIGENLAYHLVTYGRIGYAVK